MCVAWIGGDAWNIDRSETLDGGFVFDSLDTQDLVLPGSCTYISTA